MADEITAQEVFNIAASGLLKQNAQSIDDGSCVYRHEDGRKCAVGFLITDAEYNNTMEGVTAAGLMEKGLFPARLVPHFCLIMGLQDIHDDEPVKDWKHHLRALAIGRGLATAEIGD